MWWTQQQQGSPGLRTVQGKRRSTRRSSQDDDTYDAYDALFLNTLFVGPCEARPPKMKEFRAMGIEPSLYELPNVDFRRARNQSRGQIPPGSNPLFFDLQQLPERPETIHRYMRPMLRHHAAFLANQIHSGRLVYINCKLGQNRSAMLAIATLVAYKRQYGTDPGDRTYSASRALRFLRRGRPVLKPHDWVMQGFELIGYEPRQTRITQYTKVAPRRSARLQEES